MALNQESRPVFTTGQVAKICNVASRTATKWFDSGQLRGYLIPGSKDRRVPRRNLIEFMREHGIPPSDLLPTSRRNILIVGAADYTHSELRTHLRESDDFVITTAASGVEAGLQAATVKPDCVIVDLSMGRIEAGQIAQTLRGDARYRETVIVALTFDKPDEEVSDIGITEIFRKPINGAHVAVRLRCLLPR